ncbi:leucine--tRNA ligase [Mucilaginibacter paludis]|uniref:Leucine--tRNA ligase n=1 Tax=Mucilaginibacter paludis DSM 18603 TaxID=714943 RepID=H1YEZ9_9SPHI|nr:leucine--tRNA ligase [Mucilaginibacter paludis]EHQ25252.1 leucyl-tRNA synthetase [Mucilaginibacter paludis DSM 18603]
MDYQFKDIEKKWQSFWAANQTFKADSQSTKPKYYVLDMFPYPSGAGLHVGHPLGYIASDIFARYKRLKGFNVLHPMGYDSFGLPAEQYAIQTGQHPAITTEDNIATYRRQLDQIGFSFDWSREVRTSSPDYYKWTQWIFMQLFNSWYNKEADKAESIDVLIQHFETAGSKGIKAVSDDDTATFSADEWKAMGHNEQQTELLKYRLTYLRESTVNWCAALGTVLANDEVKDGFSERGGYPVEQKKMMQWSMRITAYAERLLQGLDHIDWPEPLKEMQRNWIGKSVGAMVKFRLTPALSKGEGVEKTSKEIAPKTSSFGYETADKNLWEILKANSRSNRQNLTEAENILWQLLRNNQSGYKIRRQHPIDGYIADFVCLGKGLVIEVDGGYHIETQEQDELRTKVLNDWGFDVIRFSNNEVLSNPEDVVKAIKTKLDKQADRKIDEKQDSEVLSFGEDLGEASFIEVFTTRVDTIFGVTLLVIAPEHELVQALTTPEHKAAIDACIAQTKKKSELDRMADTKTISGAFTGSYVVNPLNGNKIQIWIADYVLAGYGTGAVMAVPSGDQRDYLFAKHFNLPIIPILDSQNIETEADPTKEGKYINSDFINGLECKEATTAVIAKLEEIGMGSAKINYRQRDAIFGRQRYWGEPVPVYFKDGLPYLIEESELPLILPEVDKYLPTESGEPPLARAEDWKYKPKAAPGAGFAYEYELSTMPGWAGSSWYWYRYMDAQNPNEFASKEAIAYWKDVDLYIGGSEHATGHLLYSRFWNKFLKDIGLVIEEEPFKKLINQGMIQGRSNFVYRLIDNDGRGTNTFVSFGLKDQYNTSSIHVDVNIVENDILNIEKFKQWRPEFENADFILENGKYICGVEVEKMSKRYYNVVNPDDIATRYGADTLRMYEMFLGPLEQSKPWNTNGIEGVFKFLRKFWRLFHTDSWDFKVSDEAPTKAELKSLHKIIRKVEEDIDRFSFNTSVSSFMIAVNELTDLKCNKRSILQDMVIILSPYAPHICEELWTLLGNAPGTLSYAPYPKFNAAYLIENEFAYPISINGKTRMNLNVPLSLENTEVEAMVLGNADIQKYLEGKTPKKVIVVKGRIVNIVI